MSLILVVYRSAFPCCKGLCPVRQTSPSTQKEQCTLGQISAGPQASHYLRTRVHGTSFTSTVSIFITSFGEQLETYFSWVRYILAYQLVRCLLGVSIVFFVYRFASRVPPFPFLSLRRHPLLALHCPIFLPPPPGDSKLEIFTRSSFFEDLESYPRRLNWDQRIKYFYGKGIL